VFGTLFWAVDRCFQQPTEPVPHLVGYFANGVAGPKTPPSKKARNNVGGPKYKIQIPAGQTKTLAQRGAVVRQRPLQMNLKNRLGGHKQNQCRKRKITDVGTLLGKGGKSVLYINAGL